MAVELKVDVVHNLENMAHTQQLLNMSYSFFEQS